MSHRAVICNSLERNSNTARDGTTRAKLRTPDCDSPQKISPPPPLDPLQKPKTAAASRNRRRREFDRVVHATAEIEVRRAANTR
jgi:hypothetical protein